MKTKSTISLLLLLLAMIAMPSCSDKSDSEPQSDQPVPMKLSQQQREILNSSTDFSNKLLATVSAAAAVDENVCLSPLSLAANMAMLTNMDLSEGAHNEIVKALGLAAYSVDDVNATYHDLLTGIAKADATTVVDINSSMWYNSVMAEQISPCAPVLTRQYNAHIEAVAPGSSDYTERVNQWVFNATQGKIPSLGDVPPLTYLSLLNAVYFEGKWSIPFDASLTADGTFTTNSGKQVTVPMMHNPKLRAHAYYDDSDGTTLLLQEYGTSNAFRLYIIMPREGTDIRQFAAQATYERMRDIVSQGGNKANEIDLTMPRFEIKSRYDMCNMLSALGIKAVFNVGSVFNSVASAKPWVLKEVRQDNYIKVDEAGTTAASVAQSYIGDTSVGIISGKLDINRPFAYLITENTSGTILFSGIVSDPSK